MQFWNRLFTLFNKEKVSCHLMKIVGIPVFKKPNEEDIPAGQGNIFDDPVVVAFVILNDQIQCFHKHQASASKRILHLRPIEIFLTKK